MKKYFMLFAAAVAAVAIVSCGDEKNEGQKEVEETLEDAEKALVAYLPLDSANQAVSIGEGISFVELGGQGEFAEQGFKGGAYNNKSADHEVQAYAKFTVPETFLSSKTSFTVTAWINAPTQRGGIMTFDGGEDANWGAWDLFLDGGDQEGTKLKGYMYNSTSEWKGFFPEYKGLEVAQNKWIQVAYSYNQKNSHANLYVNGVLVGPADDKGNIDFTVDCYAGPEKDGAQEKLGALALPSVSVMYVGAFASRETGKSAESWLSYFGGKIDEIHVYNKAFSDKLMLKLFKAEVAASDIE